jgi:hypothetical protein
MLDITPEMRKSVLEEGQPLWSIAPIAIGAGAAAAAMQPDEQR